MPTKRKAAQIIVNLGTSDEAHLLQANISAYFVTLGWTHKRAFLIGIASIIGKNGDNPALVQEIADYLTGVGSRLGRPPKE